MTEFQAGYPSTTRYDPDLITRVPVLELGQVPREYERRRHISGKVVFPHELFDVVDQVPLSRNELEGRKVFVYFATKTMGINAARIYKKGFIFGLTNLVNGDSLMLYDADSGFLASSGGPAWQEYERRNQEQRLRWSRLQPEPVYECHCDCEYCR